MATGDNQIVEESYAWINSPYKFTQPVRYFTLILESIYDAFQKPW